MKKILHFEDEPMLAQMFQKHFKKENFEYKYYLSSPKDPTELVNLVLAENPDLILTNMLMPGMDGFKLTEVLKADEKTKNIPIFALTSLGQEEDIKKGIDLGMTDYFIKAEQTPSELVKKIKEFFK